MITQKQINEIAKKIARDYKPEKIILFGSYAMGTPTKESDLDLLIIKDNPLPARTENRKVRQLVSQFNVPVDIIVKSSKDFKKYKDVIGTIVYPAVKFGKILYETK